MSVKELYRAFIDGRRVKGKIILMGYQEGFLAGITFSKNKNGQVVCRGLIKDDHVNSVVSFFAEDLTLAEESQENPIRDKTWVYGCQV